MSIGVSRDGKGKGGKREKGNEPSEEEEEEDSRRAVRRMSVGEKGEGVSEDIGDKMR